MAGSEERAFLFQLSMAALSPHGPDADAPLPRDLCRMTSISAEGVRKTDVLEGNLCNSMGSAVGIFSQPLLLEHTGNAPPLEAPLLRVLPRLRLLPSHGRKL